MNIWTIAGEIALSLLILFFAWFMFVSIREREKAASVRSAMFLVFFLILNILFLLVPYPLKIYLFAGAAILLSVALIFLFLSSPPAKSIQISGEPKRVDERDVIFSRFDLREESAAFKNYYSHHPEFLSVDSQIRRMPDLFDPIHNKKNPRLFALAAAEFDFLEHQLTEVDGKTAPSCLTASDEENARVIKQIIRYLGSDLCGIAPLEQSYIYSHTGRGPDVFGEEIHLDHRYAIVFAVEMELAMVASAPRAPAVVETGKQYVEASRISIITANFIRRIGYPARAHVAGSNYQAILPPLGWQAGLGELGRSGTLVTTKYGPRARLGLVTTSLPLKTDKPKSIGVQNFCEKCRKCAVNCPVQAIPLGKKKEENSVIKWVLKREECYRYWRNTGTDCAVCMYVCPYSKPDNAFHRFIRNMSGKSSAAQSLFVWGDDFFYGRKPARKKSPLV